MPDPALSQSSGNRTSFASLLASLTGAAKESGEPWDSSAVADDVSTISYEQALRTHRRVHTSQFATETLPERAPALTRRSYREGLDATDRKKRKTASITIRLTADEQTQLNARAAEAGLSISAYLRSCIFEAESLRTQVKQALSQMRETAAHEPHIPEKKQTSDSAPKRFHLFSRLMHR